MKPEFMIDRNGKIFCLYAGLLDEAHKQGLKEIRTTLLQIPTNDNGQVAICQSEVHTERGIFTGLGDASTQNVARPMATCLIRMAETRAKARALRDAVNVAMVSVEELDVESSGDPIRSPDTYLTHHDPSTAAGDTAIRERGPQPTLRTASTPSSADPLHRSPDPPLAATDGITAAQRKMLESLVHQAGETLAIDTLSRREASQKIGELKARLKPAYTP